MAAANILSPPMKRDTRHLFFLLALWLLSCTALSAESVYRWYTDADELREAVRATGGRPVLIFFGKSNCEDCNVVWTLKNYLQPESQDFLSYMEKNQILGLKIKDTNVLMAGWSHLKTLNWTSTEDSIFGGEKKTQRSPFLAFVQLDPESSSTGKLAPSKEIINSFGTAAPLKEKITCSNVLAWLAKLQKTTAFLKVYSPDQVPDPGEDGDDSGETGGDTGGDDPTVDEMPYHWYTDVDKLRDAVKVYDRPVLIFFGKSNCSICNTVWNNSGYLEPTSEEFLSYMEENQVFGLKIRDSTLYNPVWKHLKSLNWNNTNDTIFGGGTKEQNSPFLSFVRFNPENDSTGDLDPETDIIKCFDTASTAKEKYTRSNVLAWLTKLMSTEEFQEAFATAEPEGEVLEFWETAEDLGVTSAGSYDTSQGVARVETGFNAETPELKFTFAAKAGRRYVFSVTGSSATGAPSLAELVSSSENLSATIYPLGTPETPVLPETGSGFAVLDEGVFFVPEKTGNYVLCLKLDQAPSGDLPFALRYHYSPYTGKAGSADTPFWTWNEANVGKWTMDYDGVVKTTEKRPFLLYVGGVAWCPHCVVTDRLVFDNAAFQSAVKGYPLVMLDNRRRGEATGPSLLYSPEYQSYLQSELKQTRGISSDLEETIAAKLSRNHEIQESLCLPGASTIPYPTLLFCETDGKGGVRVVDRVIPLTIPEGADLSEFSQELVESMASLLDDKSEEKDNESSTTEAVLSLGSDGFNENALIGGLDCVDWRILEASASANWKLQVASTEAGTGYESDAVLTLSLYDEDGTTLKQSVTGSWSDAPELLFNVVEDQKLLLKISVDNAQETTVPYVLKGETSLPPYEIAFQQAEWPVTGNTTGTCDITLTWKKLVTDTTETGKVRLVLPEGVTCNGSTEIPFGGTASGSLNVTLSGLQRRQAESAASVDSTLSLEAVENCRVAKPGEATVKYYTLPILGKVASGETLNLTMSENADGKTTLAILSGYGNNTLSVETTNAPEWLTVRVVNDQLVFEGTPTSSGDVEFTVTLKTGDRTGGSYPVKLQVKPLSDLNPAAANTTHFTGRVYPTDENGDKRTSDVIENGDKRTSDVIKITRDTEKRQLVVTVQGEHDKSFTLSDWSLDSQTNSVTAKDQAVSPIIDLAMTPAGEGTGELTLGGKYSILFSPDVTATTAEDYLGRFHVAMSFGGSKDFQGFGFLQFTVKEAGSVALTGEMPNGATLGETALQLCKATDATDAALDFYLTFNDESVLSGELTINRQSDTKESGTRISGCDGVKWHQKDSSVFFASQSCGVTFDPSKGILDQLVGSDKYQTLDLYVFGKSDDLSDIALPNNVVGALLPLGVTLEEKTTDSGVVFQASEREGYALVPGLGLTVEITSDGILQGGFNLFQEDGTTREAAFRGIFTPVPASCCGSDPDAIAYGRIVLDDKSWPVMIIPNQPADLDDLRTLELQSVAGSKLGWSDKKDSELGVLVDATAEKKLLGYSTASDYACELPASGSKLYAATAKDGYIPEGDASKSATVLELTASLSSGSSSESGVSAEGQWFLLAMPAGFQSEDAFPTSVRYVLGDDGKDFHSLTATEDSSPDEVFFLYLKPGEKITLKGLQFTDESAATDDETTADSRGFLLVPEDDESVKNGEIWHWEGAEDAFRPGAPESISGVTGFRQGVWCKAATTTAIPVDKSTDTSDSDK